MKHIALYARVSTAKQEEEQTIQIQISTLHDYAAKNGLTIVREYLDEGWSGDTLVRPALDRLRQDARGKYWTAVLIYDPDRLARRYSYQELVMDELREAGIEIIFVTLPAPKNSEDKILHGVRGLFAEYERAKISERFRLGKLRKAKEGHIQVTVPLYGYSYIAKTEELQGHYKIDENEARIVRMIFSWVGNEGLTIRKVVRRLKELGIKPRKSKWQVWSTSTLSTMLRHKGYIGQAHWGKSYGTIPDRPRKLDQYKKRRKTSRKINPEDQWHNVSIPAIVDTELFIRVGKQLDTNRALCIRNKKNEYLLAGKIWCECGQRRTGEGVLNGKHLYYRCSDRVNSFPLPPTCKHKSLHARAVDKAVWEKISELMSDETLIMSQVERYIASQNETAVTAEHDIVALETEAKRLHQFEDRYNKAYAAGMFTFEKLAEYVRPIKENLASIDNQIASLEAGRIPTLQTLKPTRSSLKSLVEKAKAGLQNLSFQSKRAIVTDVIEKVIGTREKLLVSGFLSISENVELFSNHRNGVSTYPHLSLPFSLSIKIPSPQLDRVIVARDSRGKIVRSILK